MMPKNVNRKINPREKADGAIVLYADKTHRLSPAELGDLRHRLRAVQLEADPEARLRARRLLDLVDRAEELEARQQEIGAAADSAVDLADAAESLVDTVEDAIRFNLEETAADLIADGVTDPHDLASRLLGAVSKRLREVRERVSLAAVELKTDAENHATTLKGLNDEEDDE